MHLDLSRLALLLAAGLVAGTANSIAGGGSLISFPALLLVGLPALGANVTNTVALLPGYLSGTIAARGHLRGQRWRAWTLLAPAAAGGVLGAFLLTRTAAHFRGVVPWLLLSACLLLAVQPWLGVLTRSSTSHPERVPAVLALVFAAGVYGGFFGAGLGVLLLAGLALFFRDPLPRLNALKQLLSLLIGAVAAVWFALSATVAWDAAAALAAGSLLGGVAGVALARHMDQRLLRVVVVVFGVAVAVVLLL